MELFGESYDRFFELPQGTIGVMADLYVDGETMVLENLLLYPVGCDELPIGVPNLLSIRKLIDRDVRQLGFHEA